MKKTKNDIPWIEKYRPTRFDNIALDSINRNLFQNVLKYNNFPNLLFYGPPGTGKTTTIINLINEYQMKQNHAVSYHNNGNNRENVIHLNASDERGIDIIRIQINQFVKTKNMFESGFKFVVLDEVDYMTKNAQQSLKTLLQTCRNNVRFCLICNYISKIDESLQNEFVCVRFNQLPKEEIHDFLMNISIKENIGLSDEHIETIQKIYNSDIRSMINFLQLNYESQNVSDKEINIIQDKVWYDIYAMFIDPKYTCENIIEYIHQVSIKYNMDKRTLLTTYLHFTIMNIPELISNAYLNLVENIIHIHDSVPIQDVLLYFCESVRNMKCGLP